MILSPGQHNGISMSLKLRCLSLWGNPMVTSPGQHNDYLCVPKQRIDHLSLVAWHDGASPYRPSHSHSSGCRRCSHAGLFLMLPPTPLTPSFQLCFMLATASQDVKDAPSRIFPLSFYRPPLPRAFKCASMQAFPQLLLKLSKTLPLWKTGMGLKVHYEVPLADIQHFYQPPARLMV
eukprot:1139624-Pelagomonas_calceolata.AAC.4